MKKRLHSLTFLEHDRYESFTKKRKSHKYRLLRWKKSGRVFKNIPKIIRLNAPIDFSVFSNHEAVFSFVDKANKIRENKHHISINLENVRNLSNEAIVLLLSIMFNFVADNLGVEATAPLDFTVNDRLDKSGFFEFMSGANASERNKKAFNKIHTKNSKEVDSEFTDRILQQATTTIWGDKRGNEDIQRVFVELMMNTNKHADPNKEASETWWLSAEHDEENKKVSFAFVDNGVGILESIDKLAYKQGKFRELRALIKNDKELLQDIMEGKLKSRTGLSFRGKGLPASLKAFQRKSFSKFTIVTNGVYADFEKNTFKTFQPKFSGTLIFFELSQENNN
jgi:hypothetical protein